MKKSVRHLAAALALLLALVSSPARADRLLTIVLDSNLEMKRSDATKVTVTYLNTMMEGFAKDPARGDLSIRLVQVCVRPDSALQPPVAFFYETLTRKVGDKQKTSFEATRAKGMKESPIDHPNVKAKFQNWISETVAKCDGIVLVSSATGATAVNLGGGFSRVVKPTTQSRSSRLDKDAFTGDLRAAVEDFLSYNVTPDFRFKALSNGPVYAGDKASFEFESANIDAVSVLRDREEVRGFADGLAKKSFDIPFETAGTYVVSAVPKRRGKALDPVTVTVRVVDRPVPAVARLSASATEAFAPAEVVFSIALENAKTAAVDFGDGRKDTYRDGAPDIRHVYENPGRYTASVVPAGEGKTKTTQIDVKAPAIQNLAVSPDSPNDAQKVKVSFSVLGARSASVDFGQGGQPRIVQVAENGRASAEADLKPGTYTIVVSPLSGGKKFPGERKLIVVVHKDVPPGVSIQADPPKLALNSGPVSFALSLQNAAKAEVDFGDGALATIPAGKVEHEFSKVGKYTVTARAVSADGLEQKDSCTVEVVPPPTPAPSCSITADGVAELGSAFRMDLEFSNTESATVSFTDAPDAEPQPIEIDEEGKAYVTHEFRADGDFKAVVSMKNGPKTAQAEHAVSIAKPEESFGEVVVEALNANGEMEPLPDSGTGYYTVGIEREITIRVKQRNVDISVDYGDETDVEKGSTTSHTYQEPGEYVVTVRGKGKVSKSSKGSKTVTVSVKGNPPPVLPVLLVLVLVGGAVFAWLQITKPKSRLKETQYGSSSSKSHDFAVIGHSCTVLLDGGTSVKFKLLNDGDLSVSSPSSGVSANGQTLTQAPKVFSDARIDVQTSSGTWTFQKIDK